MSNKDEREDDDKGYPVDRPHSGDENVDFSRKSGGNPEEPRTDMMAEFFADDGKLIPEEERRYYNANGGSADRLDENIDEYVGGDIL